jgi:2-hydroxychromene-2-carboxylate isomerase
MKNPKYIEFYFDCSSPWTYLAFLEILPLSLRQNLEIIWKPILVGGVFNKVNQDVYHFREKPNALKLQYAKEDLLLWQKLRSVTISLPDIFPINSVRAMRGCFFALEQGKLPEYANSIFEYYWKEGKDISDLPILLDIAKKLGFVLNKFQNFIESRHAKDLLIKNTNELIKRGGFGSPTFFYQNHMFFGNDRLALFEELLVKGYLEN